MKDYQFGNYLCELRNRRGLSQFQLGTLVGLTDKAVSKWENGDAKPRLDTCYRLAEVLGVSIDALLSCKHQAAAHWGKQQDALNARIWKEAYDRLAAYCSKRPAVFWSRLASEEAALQGTDAIQGYAVLGCIKQRAREANTAILVNGSIGASFAAWLLGATEINPLTPYYICPACGCTAFVPDAGDGFDLPPKKCICGQEMQRDGHNIPFEGYAKAEHNGTCIEIRVSERFKPEAIKALLEFYDGAAEVLPVMVHGEGDAWCMEQYVVLSEQNEKIEVSKDGFFHIEAESYWRWKKKGITFAFLSGDLLNKIEEMRDESGCGLPDPLQQITPQMAEILYQKKSEKLSFITKVLSETPHNFDSLIRLELLSRATGAWTGNGESLLKQGRALFHEIPAAREDVFNAVGNALVKNNIFDKGLALYVMENTRKGLFCSRGMPEEMEQMLLSLGLPEWYPSYLKQVKYLWPKAHIIEQLLAEIVEEWYHAKTGGKNV